MYRQEILTEIRKLKREIALQPFGSPKIEALTMSLILAYDEYVKLIESNKQKQAA